MQEDSQSQTNHKFLHPCSFDYMASYVIVDGHGLLSAMQPNEFGLLGGVVA